MTVCYDFNKLQVVRVWAFFCLFYYFICFFLHSSFYSITMYLVRDSNVTCLVIIWLTSLTLSGQCFQTFFLSILSTLVIGLFYLLFVLPVHSPHLKICSSSSKRLWIHFYLNVIRSLGTKYDRFSVSCNEHYVEY